MHKKIGLETAPLVIDCQLFQTFSWSRGMGKYSLELLRNLLNHRDMSEREVHLIFNKRAKANPQALKLVRSIAPQATIIELELELPREPREKYSVQPARLKNKAVLTEYINSVFAATPPPQFLILSLYLDEVCSVFPEDDCVSDKILLYYDSIPFLYHQRYSRFPKFFEHYYLPHTASVFEATKILTISKTVANDLQLYFGIQEPRIFNIDGAPIPREVKAVKPKGWKYHPGEFVLMPTGQELRKNNHRAVQAFETFCNRTGRDSTLVITSHFTEEGRAGLRAISGRLDFSGNVSDGELLWLYQNSSFIVFPSEYEGLGLPVLEGVEAGKVVACSDIPVFREMAPDQTFYMFAPDDTGAMVASFMEADAAASSKYVNGDAYAQILRKYEWGRTANLAVKALGAKVEPSTTRMKIAVLGPDPSGFSAIGKYLGELHAWYSQYFDIDYYFDKGQNHRVLRPNVIAHAAKCQDAEAFTAEKYREYDAVIYHIGNSEYHVNIIRAALALPGYVILHDTNLTGVYKNMLNSGHITQERYDAEAALDDALSSRKHADKSHMITSIVNNQKAIVVHSDYAKEAVAAKSIGNKRPIVHLDLPVAVPMFSDILTHDRTRVSIAFAGIIAKVKGIDIMEDIAMSEEFADCQINIFGFSAAGSEQLEKLRMLPNVQLATNTTDFEFQQLLMASDILVNARLAYRGETSASTLEYMRYGGAAIVRDFGWFSELPDTAVVKVSEVEGTMPALRELIADRNRRQAVQKKALEFVRSHHSHQAYAKGMLDLIHRLQR